MQLHTIDDHVTLRSEKFVKWQVLILKTESVINNFVCSIRKKINP